ncbi:hypothetical protein EPO15_14110 [bacterium]|nr:MAG: hypothetical protein EPO15_14110 [bacterium]
MKLLAALLLAAAPAARAADSCVSCHAALDERNAAVIGSFARDIHREKGLSCAACHGGDPTKEDMAEAMDPAKGFAGKPEPAQMSQFCGKCHSDPKYMRRYNPSLPTDQAAKYATSNHGLRLKAGDTDVATCASCHPAHSIRPPKDPTSSVYVKNVPDTCARCHADSKKMAAHKLPATVVAEYKDSVHGKALLGRGDTAAPACNTCHGNHGAAPPGVAGIGQVCGMCHVNNMEFFKNSPMSKPWAKAGFHACATCHTAHAVQKPTSALLAGDAALCARCHASSSKPRAVAAALKAELDTGESSYRAAEAAIAQAEEKGMDMADARDALDGARTSMYQARTAVHTFSPEAVAKVAGEGKAASGKALQAAQDAVKDFRDRRVGLGLSTFVIAFLAGALYLKVRDLESGE